MSDLDIKQIPVFIYNDTIIKELNTKSEELFIYALKRWLEENDIDE